MEAERIVYTRRRSTTTKIMRRTSSQQDNITATEVSDHQSKSQSPGNQVLVDNGIGTKIERMFSSSGRSNSNNNNNSASPTATTTTTTVVTRQNSGQLKQTQSDSKHHYQPQLHSLEHQQQRNYNTRQQQQQQPKQQQSQKQLRRLLIQEPQRQQQQQSPANIRLDNYNYEGNEICSNPRTGHHNNHHHHQQQQQQRHQQQQMQTSKPIQQQQRYYHQRSDFPQQQHPQQQLFDTAAVKQAKQNHQYSDYYHYCDSSQFTNPTIQAPKSSSMINSSSNNNNNYNDNILLFATEHNHNQQQQQLQSQSPAQVVQHEPPAVSSGSRQQNLSNMSSSYSSPSVSRIASTNTGRFVNYYPSWRQTQSPPTCNTNQCSFHVPFDSSTSSAMEQQRYRQQLQRQQARYGFVAPADRMIYNNSRRRFDHSFRSQTISHLPSMVKVTCLETIGTPEKQQQQQLKSSLKQQQQQQQQQQTDSFEDHRSSASRFGYENIDYGGSNYFPAIVTDDYDDDDDDNNHRSESNLLRSTAARQTSTGSGRNNCLDVHRVPSSGEYGFDNPFKPGTVLSWEADMMVKLMARGYPIEEMPQLIEAAKQVARERSHHDKQLSIAKTSDNNDKQQQQTITKKSINTINTRQQQGNNLNMQANNKNKSSDDIISDWSAGKQVWANSLSRAKSMPRKLNTIPSDAAYVTNATAAAFDYSKDKDSIDKLIADIENEMSEYLGLDGFEKQEKRQKSSTLPISQSDEPLSTMISTSAESKTLSKSGSKLLLRNNNNSSRMPKTTTSKNNRYNKKQQEVNNTKRNTTTITSANNNNNKFNDLIDNDDVIDYSGDRQRIEPSKSQVMKKNRSECCKVL